MLRVVAAAVAEVAASDALVVLIPACVVAVDALPVADVAEEAALVSEVAALVSAVSAAVFAASLAFFAVKDEAALVALLQFMAVVKAAMVAGVVAGATWRLRLPASFRTALAYAAAGGIMAAGLWPIWVATHVATGAMLVHGGFAIAMATGWRDRAAWQVLMVKRR